MSESMCESMSRKADFGLEALLIEGISKGEDIPLSADFWNELKQDAAKVLAKNKEGLVKA